MPLQKYLDRMKRMDELIRRKATGNPTQFADKLAVNRSTLMRSLTDLKNLGAPINFDSIRQTYYYEHDGSLEFGFRCESAAHFANQGFS